MITLCTTLHGSKLYRLDNSNSDTDLKSIFLPSLADCALLRATKNAQQKEGIGAAKKEHESFALQSFLQLAANGEDVAISMLHCGPSDIYLNSPIWERLRDNRARFYTRRMRGSLGYAMGMSAKYALRADRMVAVEQVIIALEKARDAGVARLAQCWDDLPNIEHTKRTISERDRGADKRVYEVVGKGLPATITPAYALQILYGVRDNYGDRVRAARNMQGSDYKALSHSFRVGYQLLGIYQQGGFSYPLPQSDFIRAVKEGRLSYIDDKLDEKLNELIAQVERAAEKSLYPERVNQDWLDTIVLDAYNL